MRALLMGLLAVGRIQSAKQVIAPEPEGGGSLSCREIVETCDTSCSDPLCLHQCSPQGTPDARAQHDALLDCGQRNGCADETCMRASCPSEIDACMGAPPPSGPPGSSEPAPPATAS
ncbi:MAG: hypothetical protein AB7O24_11355 [Kofleriaceae bacterium]